MIKSLRKCHTYIIKRSSICNSKSGYTSDLRDAIQRATGYKVYKAGYTVDSLYIDGL